VKVASLALDSNLLLLYVVGATSRGYIGKHKRLQAYAESDFDRLLEQMGGFSGVLLTPNTLTETSNLIDHISEPARGQIYGVLKALLSRPEFEEKHLPARYAASLTELPRLGLTDCTLLQLCAEGVPLLTVDLALFLAAVGRGLKAYNFNHLRDM
jgi:hypothetical protein